MKLSITIEGDNILEELKAITLLVEDELKDPACIGCTDCKDKQKGCYVGGGSSEPGLESDWKLRRNYKEHKNICKSKQRK
jgi:hypothetical protein